MSAEHPCGLLFLYADANLKKRSWAPPLCFPGPACAGKGFHHRKRTAVDRGRRPISARPTGRREQQPVSVAGHQRRPGGSKGEPDTMTRMCQHALFWPFLSAEKNNASDGWPMPFISTFYYFPFSERLRSNGQRTNSPRTKWGRWPFS